VTLDQPLWLLLLVAAPLLWWLHRRISAPRVMLVASVEALRGAVSESPADVPRRRFDPELCAWIAGVACLALAAAGPRRVAGTPSVLVVVDMSASGDQLTANGETLLHSALAAVRRDLKELDADLGVETLELGMADTPVRGELDDLVHVGASASQDAGVRPADDLPRSLAPALAFARANSYPGVVLVTDRDIPAPAGVVIAGPESAPIPGGGIVAIALDGDQVAVSVLRTEDGPVALQVRLAGDEIRVPVPRLTGGGDTRIVVVRAAAPARGTEASYSIAGTDTLAPRANWLVARVGGTRRVRLRGPGARGARTLRRLLTTLGVEIVEGPFADVGVEIVVGGPPSPPDGASPPVLQFAVDVGSGALLEVSPARPSVSGARISCSGVLAEATPSPGTSLVATGRLSVPERTLLGSWRDDRGLLAVALPRRVVVALDPEAEGSDWRADPSFPVLVLASLEHLGGGADRLQVLRGVAPGEAQRRAPPPPPAGVAALRPLVRPVALAPGTRSYATLFAVCAAGLLIAALVLSSRSLRGFSGRRRTPITAG